MPNTVKPPYTSPRFTGFEQSVLSFTCSTTAPLAFSTFRVVSVVSCVLPATLAAITSTTSPNWTLGDAPVSSQTIEPVPSVTRRRAGARVDPPVGGQVTLPAAWVFDIAAQPPPS